jgi:hypothetical protein
MKAKEGGKDGERVPIEEEGSWVVSTGNETWKRDDPPTPSSSTPTGTTALTHICSIRVSGTLPSADPPRCKAR